MKYFIGILSFLIFANVSAQSDVKKANECYRKKDYSCAFTKYKKAFKESTYSKKDKALIIQRIAGAAYEIKDYNSSLEYLKKLELTDSWPAFTAQLYGYCYYAQENYDKAYTYLQKAAKLQAKNKDKATAHFYAGECKYYSAKYNEAITSYKKAIEHDGTYVAAYYAIGNSYYYKENYKEAEKWYKKALPMSSGNDYQKGNILYSYSKANYQLSKYYSANSNITKALELRPDDYDFNWQAGRVYNKQKKYTEAIEKFNFCMNKAESNDDKRNLYFNLGLCHKNRKKEGDIKKAIDYYKKALLLDPNYLKAIRSLGNLYQDEERNKEAIALYEKALQNDEMEDKEKANMHAKMARIYAKMGETKKAEAASKKAIALDKSKASSLAFDMAKAYTEAKDWKSLRSLGNTTLAASKKTRYDSSKYLSYVALADFKTGNSKRGLATAKKSMDLSSYGVINKGDIVYYMAKNYIAKGDTMNFKKYGSKGLYSTPKTLTEAENKEWKKYKIQIAYLKSNFTSANSRYNTYAKLDSNDLEAKLWVIETYMKKSYKSSYNSKTVVKLINSALRQTKSKDKKLDLLFKKALLQEKSKLPGQKETLEELVKLKTKRANVHYVLANLYKKDKEYAKSNKVISNFYGTLTPEDNPTRAQFKVLEGVNYYYLEDKVKAKASFEEAKKLDSSNKDAQNWLDYLAKNQ